MVATIIVAVLAVACGGFALAASRGYGQSARDQELATLLNAVNQADRALYTERSDWSTSQITDHEPEPGPLDNAAAALGTAARAYGLDSMGLATKGADHQTQLLFNDPADRVSKARKELTTGTLIGAEEYPANFTILRQALWNFAQKAPSLFHNEILAPQAKAFAESMIETRTTEAAATTDQPEQPTLSIPVRIDQEVPQSDPRGSALRVLTEASGAALDQSRTTPIVLWIICGILALAAAGGGGLLWRQRTRWATPAPDGAHPSTVPSPIKLRKPRSQAPSEMPSRPLGSNQSPAPAAFTPDPTVPQAGAFAQPSLRSPLGGPAPAGTAIPPLGSAQIGSLGGLDGLGNPLGVGGPAAHPSPGEPAGFAGLAEDPLAPKPRVPWKATDDS
jgi:hypothetical protein